MQDELDSFFRVLSGSALPAIAPTKSAFSAARAKLSYGAFVELNELLVEQFYRLARAPPASGCLPSTAPRCGCAPKMS